MNDENKLSRTMLIVIFSAGIVLLIAVAFLNFIDSPKVFEPKFYRNIKTEEAGNIDNSREEINPEFEGTPFPIGINTASVQELQLIPDIGPVTAELIIEYRNENGTITDIDELITVEGIGDKTIEILKEYCIIN